MNDLTPEEQWAAYLDAVEASARSIARQAVDRDVPEASELVPPSLPAAPWPASLDDRRREVMESLAAATATVQRCRDEAARTLTALARPTGRHAYGYRDGGAVDVVG
ncbi:MAG TPA: hypothetical protein VEV65_06830 [Kineosporiaceae bacterium]|nr:hypothetical protein [Kineosporiaceae bacterium]